MRYGIILLCAIGLFVGACTRKEVTSISVPVQYCKAKATGRVQNDTSYVPISCGPKCTSRMMVDSTQHEYQVTCNYNEWREE